MKAVNLKDTYSFTSHITVYETCALQYKGCWAKRHDNIYVYSKTTEYTFNADAVRTDYAETTKERFSHAINNVRNGINFGTQSLNPLGKYPEDVLDVSIEAPSANVRTGCNSSVKLRQRSSVKTAS